MCGIFGVLAKKAPAYGKNVIQDLVCKAAIFSEARGKDSSGVAFRNVAENKISVLKGALPISRLLETKQFKNKLSENLDNLEYGMPFSFIGHARLTTNGSQLKDINNQPVVKDGMVAIHNGIIINADDLWTINKDINRNYDIDTEIILSLYRKNLDQNKSTGRALLDTLNVISGTVSSAIFLADRDECVLTTNNGSLYILTDNHNLLVFASEYHIIRRLLKNTGLNSCTKFIKLYQLKSNYSIIFNFKTFKIFQFNNYSLNGHKSEIKENPFQINEEVISPKKIKRDAVINILEIQHSPLASIEKNLLEYNYERIFSLKRCSKCLLPSSFPFIVFDDAGVCNYCRNYKIKSKPKGELEEVVDRYKSSGNRPNCIVPFSGGRDSSFVLHTLRTKYGLNPIAYTYDWGMVTDVARRNIARMCGKLGIENIIVSANISWKRENIRKNILSWLKHPRLGMIPLFMAGDKYFFYYCNQVKKQTGISLNIWGVNSLENTDFKTGFAGIEPNFNKQRIYSLDFLSQMKLFTYVGKNLVQSPGYINQSLLDSLGSFVVRYLYPIKDYYHFFDYYQWDEKEIENTLLTEYKWETAADTSSTWRIGDGTASFYNYIYCTVAGFTENDTFRSNQVREGLITREDGLKLLAQENFPRYETLKWYLEILGLDYRSVITSINNIPKIY